MNRAKQKQECRDKNIYFVSVWFTKIYCFFSRGFFHHPQLMEKQERELFHATVVICAPLILYAEIWKLNSPNWGQISPTNLHIRFYAGPAHYYYCWCCHALINETLKCGRHAVLLSTYCWERHAWCIGYSVFREMSNALRARAHHFNAVVVVAVLSCAWSLRIRRNRMSVLQQLCTFRL